jgi:hypothetical protein
MKLTGDIVYLSGPMECVSDFGVGWRQEITPKLHARGIGVIDPCNKPSDYADESPGIIKGMKDARQNGNHELVRELMKPMVGIDLRSVHKSDFLIVYVDKDVHMCGTYWEVAWAVQQMKPVLIVCKQGKQYLPGFIYGLIPTSMHFSSFDEMLVYLDKVNNGEENDRRWHFWDYDKIFGRK